MWPREWSVEPPSAVARCLGHARTVGTFLQRSWAARRELPVRLVEIEVLDADLGPVVLSGLLYTAESPELVIALHGLGGSVESGYMRGFLELAAEMGQSALLIHARGADRRGHDIHHAGLISDIEAWIESAWAKEYAAIHLLGFSLGGHTALSYGVAPEGRGVSAPNPRVQSIAAVGSPLDLSCSASAFDGAAWSVYRTHVMRSLHEIYTVAYQRNPRGLLPEQARGIRSIREWDERIIAPRFGFGSAQNYYREVSIGPRLGALKIPALYVGGSADPMIPREAVVSAAPSEKLEVRWVKNAGHLGFPRDTDLGMGGRLGLEAQLIEYFRKARASGSRQVR